MANGISGRTVVITGAGGVLCSEFARHVARCGGRVALLNRTFSKVEKIAAQIVSEGGIAKPFQVDVLDKASLANAHAEVLKEFGPCDILVNGAGGNQGEATTGCEYHELDLDPDLRSFFGLSQEAVQGVFNLNFLGTFLPTQEFVKDMIGREGCCILNVSSMSSYHPLTKVLGYSAAKSAVNNLTEWLAVHFSHVGIRVNAIAPGFFATEQNRNLLFDAQGNYTARSRKIIAGTPMGRFGVPQDLLGTVQYLIDSEASGFVTGVVIPVDGGFNAYSGV